MMAIGGKEKGKGKVREEVGDGVFVTLFKLEIVEGELDADTSMHTVCMKEVEEVEEEATVIAMMTIQV